MSTRIVFVSDTHDRHDRIEVPEGDVLIHCGDGTVRGRPSEIAAWAGWMRSLPHARKVFVAGNHDLMFERDQRRALGLTGLSSCGERPRLAVEERRVVERDGLIYLQDAEVEVDGVRVYGAPWQPWFHSWAFNLPRGELLAAKWALVPDGIDVLVTHGPPRGILDACPVRPGDPDQAGASSVHVGCDDLKQRIAEVQPRVHAFGHIHEARGVLHAEGTLFVNASVHDADYRPTNPPIVVDLPRDRSLPAVVVSS